MATQPTIFSENLKKYRKQAGYSQQELANILSISRNTYAQYENGYSTPDLDCLSKIARSLGCSVTLLLSEHADDGTAVLPEFNDRDIRFLNSLNNLTSENRQMFLDYLDFIESSYASGKDTSNSKAV